VVYELTIAGVKRTTKAASHAFKFILGSTV
jgi:hypothetical protein